MSRFDVAVLGAGPAGVMAAARASALGARTVLLASDDFGGMAANDGPVPVRTLAQAARLLRDAGQLPRYGVARIEPQLDYGRVLTRVEDVVDDVRASSFLLPALTASGVELLENVGHVGFVDDGRVQTDSGLTISADKFVVCIGGISKTLPIPGFEFTSTHSDAWELTAVPASMVVLGAGATGVQVASVFHAFGTKVHLLEVGPRLLPTSDAGISAAIAERFGAMGIDVRIGFGSVESFEKTGSGVATHIACGTTRTTIDADLVVVAVGWAADVSGLHLDRTGVRTTSRGFIEVDEYQCTSNPNVFAAGDVTGRIMLASEAIRDGYIAASNAVGGPASRNAPHLVPTGSFTDPEYASVGLTEDEARQDREIHCTVLDYRDCTRPIIDGQTVGFCKMVVDVGTAELVGCHVVGDRAVDIVQIVSVAMSAGMRRVEDIARLPVSFPTYAEIVTQTAALAAMQLGLDAGWQGPVAGRT